MIEATDDGTGDELRPGCLNCRQRGEECEWGMKITFKADNATQLDAEHPSMRVNSRKRARQFKVCQDQLSARKLREYG